MEIRPPKTLKQAERAGGGGQDIRFNDKVNDRKHERTFTNLADNLLKLTAAH